MKLALYCAALCLGLALLCCDVTEGAAIVGGLTVAAVVPFAMRDANLEVTKALPNGAAAITTDGFDLMNGANGDFVAPCELHISAPALGATPLPDDKTMTYDIEHDTDSAFGTTATLLSSVIVQTGAGSAGDDAATKQVRLPANTNRYVRVKVTGSASGDASGEDVTARLVF